ncbi:hypothetical protein TCAL_02197 [Tigriopus californicus]|uniref:Uncharacterized protein n=1 Tax=Tigriopus californicus TaxID=6832 RepID=A0A553P5W1_TIGCA|nr:uncharacterized protein LOC131878373 [Tigriopus californicus]TRY73075.1 hypothetical protein TCAL_02197 [Tigriopus californicus]|eukprot:TCALIF_02197-PA protein Name:"Protein of unknown function" AED:0.00 eAED:0.00 QI:127/1/1/1/1/1/2/123/263
MADFVEYNNDDELSLYNMTAQELLERVDKLERQLDFYIPMYWSLVVVLVAIAFFVCVLILPERRRRHFKDLLRVETLKANHEAEEDLQNYSQFSSRRLSLADDDVFVEMADPHSNDESLFNALEQEPSAQYNEGFDFDDVDLNKKHRYLKRTELILKPRTLPDFQEIISYDPNQQPIYRDSNSRVTGQDSNQFGNSLKPEAIRKNTRDAVLANSNNDRHHDGLENYSTKPHVTKEDEEYKASIQKMVPGLSITRPSVNDEDLS